MRRDAGGEREQADLAGGVEAEAEEDPERVHLPARIDAVDDAAEEEAVHRGRGSSSALLELASS